MFTRAITRKPCKALIDGISTAQFCDGTPDYEAAVKQHDKYVAVLRELGLEITELEADERYPDSCFIVDPDELYAINSLMDTGEFKKIDGSLTCLSLRF